MQLEVRPLPSTTFERPEMLARLMEQVLKATSSGTVATKANRQKSCCNTTIITGMGGVGKTTLATELVHDEEVRSLFDRICWVSVGQEPDICSLQAKLYRQLVNRPMEQTARDDELIGLGVLVEVAKSMAVLLCATRRKTLSSTPPHAIQVAL